MGRQFGNSLFQRPLPKSAEQKLDEGICIAFGQGSSAARNDRLRSENPYRPMSQPELYQAWNCGYDEENEVYTVC